MRARAARSFSTVFRSMSYAVVSVVVTHKLPEQKRASRAGRLNGNTARARVSAARSSMRHRVEDDVDAHRVRLRLGERAEVALVLALTFPPVAKVGVVADDHHHPPLVVEKCAVMHLLRPRVPRSIGGDRRIRAALPGDRRHLRLLLQVKNG